MSDIGREASNLQESLPNARLGRLFRRRVLQARGEFDCGVRVLSGTVPGEGSGWKHRRSTIDGDVLEHGSNRLRLQILEQVRNPGGFKLSANCVVWTARLLDGDATVQLAFMPANADTVLASGLAAGRTLALDPQIDAL